MNRSKVNSPIDNNHIEPVSCFAVRKEDAAILPPFGNKFERDLV